MREASGPVSIAFQRDRRGRFIQWLAGPPPRKRPKGGPRPEPKLHPWRRAFMRAPSTPDILDAILVGIMLGIAAATLVMAYAAFR